MKHVKKDKFSYSTVAKQLGISEKRLRAKLKPKGLARPKKIIVSGKISKQLGGDSTLIKDIWAWVKEHPHGSDPLKNLPPAIQNLPQSDLKAILKRVKDMPDFPDCSDYHYVDNPSLLADMIRAYRVSWYSQEFRTKNESHYKAAREALLDIQEAYPELQGIVVPLARDITNPTEQDFLNLEKCASEFNAGYDKTQPASGEAGDEIKTTSEAEKNADKIFGDKFSFWGLEIYWRNVLAKFKKLMSRKILYKKQSRRTGDC